MLGYKKKSFALIGASAGAPLALMYAYANDSQKMTKTVVDIVGPTDLSDSNLNSGPDRIFRDQTLPDTTTLLSNAFRLGTAATEADDRIILNSKTGELMYDADGLGGASAVRFATLSGTNGVVSASDFIII